MELFTMSWIDYILFCIVFGGSSLLGVYFGCCGSRQETKSDYLLGGRKMAVTRVAVSLIASTLSSSSLLGIPTEMYLYGTQYWMMCVSVLIAGLCTNYIFLPVYYKLGITTLYEYLEMRFNVHVRRMVSFIYLLDSLTMMPCFVYAPALALNQMSGFNIHLIAITLTIVCIFYTALGGLRSVVWTSTLQFCITLCTLCAIIVMGCIAIGGWSHWTNSHLNERLEFLNINPDPTLRATFWSVVIGNAFIWINYTGANPATMQRLLSLPTLSNSRKTLFAYIIGTVIAKSLCCFNGLIMFVKYYTCDPWSAGYVLLPDQIFPYYVLDVACNSPGVSGLFVAAMFSTALSALSSVINSLAGTIYTDLVEKWMPNETTERTASNTIKVISVLLGFITVGLIFVIEKLGTILQLIVSFSGIVAGPSVGVALLGLLFPRSNSKGAICGSAAAIVAMWFMAVARYVNAVDNTVEYLPKPLNTYGCNSTNVLATLSEGTNDSKSEPFWLFKISFYYYGFIGAAITVIIGLLVSVITNRDTKQVTKDLVSPLVQRYARQNVTEETMEAKVTQAQTHVVEPLLLTKER